MKIIDNIKELRKYLALIPNSKLALVPTMGNLHAGHLSLVKQSQQIASKTIVSIFVNPLQFGVNEDLDLYPRTLENDIEKLEKLNVDILFIPKVAEIYPQNMQNIIKISIPNNLDNILCGANRLGHFVGVATIVNKLFNIIQPNIAVFGEKEFQQLLIIKRMVIDLSMPIEIISVPTKREKDGLAMSSRNIYLSANERKLAPHLYLNLLKLRRQVSLSFLDWNKEHRIDLEQRTIDNLIKVGFKPDYISIRTQTLELADKHSNDLIMLAAVKLGKTRLIDNLSLN
jgi:pantoate--beta-alanine ligase